MNRNHSTSFTIRLLMLVFSMTLFGADLVASAQNANSSTTTQEDTSAQNDNTSGTNMTRGGRRRRRGRRRSETPPSACGEMPEPTNVFVTDRPVMMQATGRCDPMTQEQTDLSGTYTGRVGYTDVVMAGDATLTISGNNFTLANGQTTEEGRIVAVTTCNYTAVTMRFGTDAPVAPGQTPPPPLPTVSLRARKTGSGLNLDTVPGESRQFSFHSTGASGGGMSGGMPRVRGRRRGGNKNGSPNPVGIKPPTAM